MSWKSSALRELQGAIQPGQDFDRPERAAGRRPHLRRRPYPRRPRELYLGKGWWAGTTAEHQARCAEQGVPPERAAQVATKPELARRMLERALKSGVPFSYFLADEAYGQCAPGSKRAPGALRVRNPEERGAAAARRPHPADPRAMGGRARGGVRAPLVRGRRQRAARVRLGHRPTRLHRRRVRAPPADPPLHRAQQEGEEDRPTRPRGRLLPMPHRPRRDPGRTDHRRRPRWMVEESFQVAK